VRGTLVVISAVFCAMSISASPADAAEVDMARAKTVFEKTCGLCHGLDRPLEVAGRDREGWVSTVRRMSGRNADSLGAPIAAEDQAAIVEYLLANAGRK
jgi:mono/diheme cytochrome c family protein